MRGAPRVICSLKILQFWGVKGRLCSAFFLSFSFSVIHRESRYTAVLFNTCLKPDYIIVRVYLVFSSSFALTCALC